jgi:hypothetical protein
MVGRTLSALLRLVPVVLLFQAPPATSEAQGMSKNSQSQESHSGRREKKRFSIPEFDPAAAGVIAALIAGGGIVLARRRTR